MFFIPKAIILQLDWKSDVLKPTFVHYKTNNSLSKSTFSIYKIQACVQTF